MWKLSIILFIIVGPTLAGIGALVPLSIFGAADFDPLLLIAAAVAGALVAMPVSYLVAKRIGSLMNSSPSAQW
jgi:membrane protein DedA with SNARE-associated domain